MSYRYDDSYPFFSLARRHGASYAHVLIYADVVLASVHARLRRHNEWQAEAVRALTSECKIEVSALCAQPTHLRGGRREVTDAR